MKLKAGLQCESRRLARVDVGADVAFQGRSGFQRKIGRPDAGAGAVAAAPARGCGGARGRSGVVAQRKARSKFPVEVLRAVGAESPLISPDSEPAQIQYQDQLQSSW